MTANWKYTILKPGSTYLVVLIVLVEHLADGHEQATQTLETVLVAGTQQLVDTAVHDGLIQDTQLEQFTDEPASGMTESDYRSEF